MPTVAQVGRVKFVVNTREQVFEPPHVHVWIGNEDQCRIELNGGEFMETPPPGAEREIRLAFASVADEINKKWNEIHAR